MRYYKFIDELISSLDAYALNDKYKFADSNCKDVESKDARSFDLRYLIKSVDYINAFGDYTYSIGGMEVANIEVPEFFKYMLFPTEVYFEPSNRFSTELIDREEIGDFTIDWNQFRKACNNVSAHFRMGKSFKMVKLSDIRMVKSLNDEYSNGLFETNLRFDGVNYKTPVPLKSNLKSLYGDNYFNEELDSYMKDYINRFLSVKMRESLEQ